MSFPVSVAGAANVTADALLEFTLANGTNVLGATINRVGKGTLAVLLAPQASAAGDAGFGLVRHLLDRLDNETSPVIVRGKDGEGNGGVQVLLNRLRSGWAVTLINNNGVEKQPASDATIDAAQMRSVVVALRAGRVVAARVSDGRSRSHGAGTHVLPVAGNAVSVEVPAGDLRVVYFVVE